MSVFKIALWASAICSALGCSSTGPVSGRGLWHSIPVDSFGQVLFSSSASRTADGGCLLEQVRCEVSSEEGSLREVRIILFDDLNDDGLPQVAEERAEASAVLRVPARYVEWSALRGDGPMRNPALWVRVVTTRGEGTDSWPVSG